MVMAFFIIQMVQQDVGENGKMGKQVIVVDYVRLSEKIFCHFWNNLIKNKSQGDNVTVHHWQQEIKHKSIVH